VKTIIDNLLEQCVTTAQKMKKDELLAHYAKRKPKAFHQFDGFCGEKYFDDVIHPDADGHALMCGVTWELMCGASVRVLIPVGETSATDAAAMLRKIADWVERGGSPKEGEWECEL
jgi:hypothetical protein